MAKEIFAAPPIRTLYPQDGTPGIFSRGWIQWFQAIANSFNMLQVPNTPPPTSTSPGIAGQIAYDANFLYVAVDANTWKRVALVAF